MHINYHLKTIVNLNKFYFFVDYQFHYLFLETKETKTNVVHFYQNEIIDQSFLFCLNSINNFRSWFSFRQ